MPLVAIMHGGEWCDPFEFKVGRCLAPERLPGEMERPSVYQGDLKICTWNAQGLFTARLDRARDKSLFLLRLAASADVLVVQEAHCCRCYSAWADEQLANTHITLWSSLDNSPVGGLGFIISRRFFDSNFTTWKMEKLQDGRIAALRMSGSSGTLQVYNVHLDHSTTANRVAQLHLLADHRAHSEPAHFVFAGDWNFVVEPGDRAAPGKGQEQDIPDPEADLWERLFPNVHEVYQVEPTRKGGDGGQWSRLDRVYSSLHFADLMSMQVGANIIQLPDFTTPLSDHFPVFASIQNSPRLHRSPFPRRIPDWIFRDPNWSKAVESMAADRRILDMHDPWLGLQLIKDIFHDAAELVLNSASTSVSGAVQFRLGKTMGALKAIRTLDKPAFDKCCKAYPALALQAQTTASPGDYSWPPPPAGVQALRDHAAALARDDIRERIETELHTQAPDMDVDGYSISKRARVNILLEIHKCWRMRRTPSTIAAVLRPDGSITSDPKEMADVLSQHWQKVFSKAPPDPRQVMTFMENNMPQFPSISWHVTEDDFQAVLKKSGNSAPGPDGIPYGCWRAAPRWIQSLLYTCCSSWLQGAQLPVHFNWSFLTLLPKIDATELKPKDTRPLSLGNGDAKLFASALQAKFENGSESFISQEQSGFVRGRSIIGNIVETEAVMISHSLQHKRAAAIFFDFTAAFPSLAHVFLWEALRAAGIPLSVIAAIKQLYTNNAHWLKMKGSVFPSVLVRSGVKQGCPLSPTLFIVAGEAILRYLKQHLRPPHDHISGYADDTAIILGSLWKSAPALALAFAAIASVSGLELNGPKCVLVPLWIRPAGPLRYFQELVPAWRNFKIALSVKYLGALIGPDSHQERWASVDRKFQDRLSAIASLGLGHFFSTLFYKVYAISVFSYLMQFFEPREWHTVQTNAIKQIVKGPRDWIPISWMVAQVAEISPPSRFPNLEDIHAAVLMRCATCTFPRCSEINECLRKVLDCDDAPLWHPWSSWQNRSSASTLAAAASRARPLLRASPLDDNHSLQTHLYRILQDRRGSIHPFATWNRRLKRWAMLATPVPFIRIIRGRLLHVLHSTSTVPAATRWALFRTYLNGWCTARRFQTVATCPFCKNCEDSLEHFSRCPVVREVGNERLDLNLSAARPLRFFMLEGEHLSKDQAWRHAAFLHALYRTHNYLRHHHFSGSMQERIWSEVRSVCMRHPQLIEVVSRRTPLRGVVDSSMAPRAIAFVQGDDLRITCR